MYEVKLEPRPGFLYNSLNGSLYGRITCQVILNYFQYVPAPLADDITVINNQITVELKIVGEESNTNTLRHGTFLVKLLEIDSGLTIDGVRNAIGNTVYYLTVNTNYDGSATGKSTSGTISQDSDIDIE